MSKEEIALEITKSVIEQCSFTHDNVKTLPYEIYNSIYNNLDCFKPSNYASDSFSDDVSVII